MTKNEKEPARTANVQSPGGAGIALMAVVCGIAGVLLGEFYPVFSNFIVKNLCAPFSPCRNEEAVAYAIGGAVVGLLLAVLSRIARSKARDSDSDTSDKKEP